jgi:hypothetical protein
METENKITKEQFDEAVRAVIEEFAKENINVDEEYEKIKQKKSNLSRSRRDLIVAIVELKNNQGFDLSPKNSEEHHNCSCHHCNH